MLKALIVLFNISLALVYSFFFAGTVTITQEFPEKVNPESGFTVTLKINKSDVAGFAKLQQELPVGFTATAIETGNASFTFSERIVKFIWVSLPEEDDFEISYKVTTTAEATGTHTINGEFAYLENNEKRTVSILPKQIIIGEGASEITASSTSNTIQEVKAIRTIDTTRLSSDNEIMVDITVNKGTIGGFAKLEETLPEGFTALEVASADGAFSFSEQTVKYLWMSLPGDETFKISYKISVDPEVTGAFYINGEFSYLENDITKKSIIEKGEIKIGEQDAEPIAEQTTEPVNTSTANNTSTENTETAEQQNTVTANIPSPQKGILYRVQIAALRRRINSKYFKDNHRINDNIFAEMHEGWNKYTIGGFPEYKSARDYRENVKEQNTITGPFVTSYNNGQRITVQEALMITNQKWFK